MQCCKLKRRNPIHHQGQLLDQHGRYITKSGPNINLRISRQQADNDRSPPLKPKKRLRFSYDQSCHQSESGQIKPSQLDEQRTLRLMWKEKANHLKADRHYGRITC